MPNKDDKLSTEQLRLLLQSMQDVLLDETQDATRVLNALIEETVKFRDKLKEETGEILTVADTQFTLSALERHISGEPLPRKMSSEQKTLLQIWIDRLTLFDRK